MSKYSNMDREELHRELERQISAATPGSPYLRDLLKFKEALAEKLIYTETFKAQLEKIDRWAKENPDKT